MADPFLNASDKPTHLWLRVLLPFAIGYFLSYLFRAVNAVIGPDLTKELGLSPGDLGLLTATYFLSFALFQIPLGILLDRYSPKRVEAVLLAVAAIGAVVFATSDGKSGLMAGRALIGLGVSACLMAGFSACAIWFPPRKIPAANAVILSGGGLGALFATAPAEAALQLTDWRGLFLALAGVSVIAALTLWLVAPERPRVTHHSTWREQAQGAMSIFKSARFWRIAPLATITQASYMAIQGLWAGPWLRNVAGLSRDMAAMYLFWTAAAMFVGQLSWGILASRLSRRGVAPLTLFKVGVAFFLATQAALAAGLTSLTLPLWIFFGFFGMAGSLSYPIVTQQFPASLAGRANTAVNLLVFVFAFAAQWAIGIAVNAWPMETGGYTVAFGGILMVQLVAFAWLLLQKENG